MGQGVYPLDWRHSPGFRAGGPLNLPTIRSFARAFQSRGRSSPVLTSFPDLTTRVAVTRVDPLHGVPRKRF